jgi:hypothetical protein
MVPFELRLFVATTSNKVPADELPVPIFSVPLLLRNTLFPDVAALAVTLVPEAMLKGDAWLVPMLPVSEVRLS